MTFPGDPLHESIVEILNKMTVLQAEEDRERALGWVVLSIDQEFPVAEEVFGVFSTPEEALIWAQRHKESVGVGQPAWRAGLDSDRRADPSGELTHENLHDLPDRQASPVPRSAQHDCLPAGLLLLPVLHRAGTT